MGWIGRSSRKTLTRLRGTNFCTSSKRFVPSFVGQPNGRKCTQMVRNAQNMSLGPNGVDRVGSLRKTRTRLRRTNFCTSSERFALNGRKNTQTVGNTPKHQFRDQWSGSSGFVAKNSDVTSWHELLHVRSIFAPSFVRHPNGPKCTQMV